MHGYVQAIHGKGVQIIYQPVDQTNFTIGSIVYFIQRVRYLEDKPLIFDTNLFLKDAVPGLTKEIAANSIYEFIEQELGVSIVTSKRQMTVERATELDNTWLQLGDYSLCILYVFIIL